MCIIIYKPKGKDLSKDLEKNLVNSFENNFDGCGFMYSHNRKVYINKGFMTIEELFSELDKIDMTELNMVFHFRYATFGEISPENCHPFPISNKNKNLRSLITECDQGIAHNGVIKFCEIDKSSLSDSQIFIKKYLSKISKNELKNPVIHELIEKSTNSKFAIMINDNVYLIGKYIEDKGIFYSNDSYKKYKYRYLNLKGLQCECCGIMLKKDEGIYKHDMLICEYCDTLFR